jgi:hypothetical protein
MKITKLKGGSLSSTSLYEGNNTFIRKEVSRVENREYGYVRWYSQLKKLQRYGSLFPDLFPKVLNVSYSGDMAYFDIEYLSDFKDIKTLLINDLLTDTQICKINCRLWESLDKIHSYSYSSTQNISTLYFKEEVEQKLSDALKIENFAHFYNKGIYSYNGNIVYGMEEYIGRLEKFFSCISLATEEYIHGNPTLENIMYSESEDRIVFIDLYEESIIDTKYLDYSQILQCSRSHYGFINDRQVSVNDTSIGHCLSVPENFQIFNNYFINELTNRNTNMQLVDILEATQFIRMLPFKCIAGELDKAKFFYLHACSLLRDIFDGTKYIR